MKRIVIRRGKIVNEGRIFVGDIVIEGERISQVIEGDYDGTCDEELDAEGKIVIPGMIDDQVHFREPGLTHKAEIYTESRAAVAGGITSYMEMPNTVPNTLTIDLLEEKYKRASEVSLANYSFFMGASNDNIEEVLKVDVRNVCGVKVFMGSSTGNMLVDNEKTLTEIFKHSPTLIATHCEDEATIRANIEKAKQQFGEDIPMRQHPIIRSEEACYLSSSFAVELAKEHGARLHILHISTEKETHLFETGDRNQKRITSEACIHHLWFDDSYYDKKGSLIKWNPAVKKTSDREGIWKAVKEGRIDVIATDHAPHTLEEKNNKYLKAPSGGPLVQHAVLAILEKVKEGVISLEMAVDKMSHAVADVFKLNDRGYIREGYFADLVIVNEDHYSVNKDNILYKCGWSPFEGTEFSHSIDKTFVSGNLVYSDGQIIEGTIGKRLSFNR